MCAPSGDQLRKLHIHHMRKNEIIHIPQSTEESTTWGIFEWLLHFSLHRPIGGSPNFDSPVVGTSCKEFAYRVPADPFHETLVLIQFPEAFWVIPSCPWFAEQLKPTYQGWNRTTRWPENLSPQMQDIDHRATTPRPSRLGIDMRCLNYRNKCSLTTFMPWKPLQWLPAFHVDLIRAPYFALSCTVK